MEKLGLESRQDAFLFLPSTMSSLVSSPLLLLSSRRTRAHQHQPKHIPNCMSEPTNCSDCKSGSTLEPTPHKLYRPRTTGPIQDPDSEVSRTKHIRMTRLRVHGTMEEAQLSVDCGWKQMFCTQHQRMQSPQRSFATYSCTDSNSFGNSGIDSFILIVIGQASQPQSFCMNP